MIKQFLLNPDGSIPEFCNVQLLAENNIPLVLPRPRGIAKEGYVMKESDPIFDNDLQMHIQAWIETPLPIEDAANIEQPQEF